MTKITRRQSKASSWTAGVNLFVFFIISVISCRHFASSLPSSEYSTSPPPPWAEILSCVENTNVPSQFEVTAELASSGRRGGGGSNTERSKYKSSTSDRFA